MSVEVIDTDHGPRLCLPGMNPIGLLLDDAVIARRAHGREPMLRAVGEKKMPHILDATAGLGRDTGIFLRRGLQVTAVEENPALAVLWRAVKRERLVFIHGAAEDAILEVAADVVYLDPMYDDAHHRRGLVKKENQVLRALAKPDAARTAALLQKARARFARVVMKRPARAPAAKGVAFTIPAGAAAYDVYLSR